VVEPSGKGHVVAAKGLRPCCVGAPGTVPLQGLRRPGGHEGAFFVPFLGGGRLVGP
jgi:hypothetical protein